MDVWKDVTEDHQTVILGGARNLHRKPGAHFVGNILPYFLAAAARFAAGVALEADAIADHRERPAVCARVGFVAF